jgi:hypothetical protein
MLLTAMNNTTPRSRSQSPIRRWPPWKINEELRREGFNHLMIARRAETSESTVSHAIRKRRINGDAVERVWAILEEVLGK